MDSDVGDDGLIMSLDLLVFSFHWFYVGIMLVLSQY